LGRGVPPWSKTRQTAYDDARGLAIGHSGLTFNSPGAATAGGDHKRGEDGTPVSRLLARLSSGAPERLLSELTGCYALAFANQEELFLFRDHAGVKVLYWTVHNDRILFASEIKALFADPAVPRKLRRNALAEYLTFSFVPGEGTMCEGVHELQPGTLLRFKRGQVTRSRIFRVEDHEFEGDKPLSPAHYATMVREALEESAREARDAAGVTPCVFVSGGVDSSAVLAITATLFPGRSLRTYSLHFGEKYANENEFVSLIVERYKTAHSWLEITPDRFTDRMEEIIYRLDDPIGDPITVPNYLMAEAASRENGFAFNGEGGDPCFGGPKNIPMMLAALYGPFPSEPEAGWVERNYLISFRKCFSDLALILSPDALKPSEYEDALSAIITPFIRAERPASFLNKLMVMNMRLKGANLILPKVDKMTSANGVLAFPPLFSKRVMEASMACPPEMKLRGNVEKWILKQAVSDLVPQPIIARPKSGMMVPVRFWFQRELRRYAKRALSKRRLARLGLFNPEYVRKLLDYDTEEVQGARHGLKLWMLVTFLHWHELILE
jgi:asparagine synthase (glutamine-hydrolysing)